MAEQQDRPVVHTVTSAQASRSGNKAQRQRQYLTMMGIRVICFVLLFYTSGWLRWVCIAAAILLPYFAVVVANAVRPKQIGTITPVTHQDTTKRLEQ